MNPIPTFTWTITLFACVSNSWLPVSVLRCFCSSVYDPPGFPERLALNSVRRPAWYVLIRQYNVFMCLPWNVINLCHPHYETWRENQLLGHKWNVIEGYFPSPCWCTRIRVFLLLDICKDQITLDRWIQNNYSLLGAFRNHLIESLLRELPPSPLGSAGHQEP